LTGDLIEISSSVEGLYLKIPQVNSFGRCDESANLLFGEPVSGECSLKFEELSECTTTFSIEKYTSMRAQAYPGSTSLALTQSVPSTLTLPAIESVTECRDALASLDYYIYYSVDNDGYNTISVIQMVYTLQTDNLVQFDSAATDNSGAYANFRYSVQYLPAGESVTERSGNPGYLYGYPLLFTQSNRASIVKFPKDFALTDNFVEFGTNGIDQCKKPNVGSIEFNCNAWATEAIFNQIDKFAIMGDPNLSVETDWQDFITENVTDSVWVAGTGNAGTCRGMLSGFRFEYMHSMMGQENNL